MDESIAVQQLLQDGKTEPLAGVSYVSMDPEIAKIRYAELVDACTTDISKKLLTKIKLFQTTFIVYNAHPSPVTLLKMVELASQEKDLELIALFQEQLTRLQQWRTIDIDHELIERLDASGKYDCDKFTLLIWHLHFMQAGSVGRMSFVRDHTPNVISWPPPPPRRNPNADPLQRVLDDFNDPLLGYKNAAIREGTVSLSLERESNGSQFYILYFDSDPRGGWWLLWKYVKPLCDAHDVNIPMYLAPSREVLMS